jgi:hypothetical protein
MYSTCVFYQQSQAMSLAILMLLPDFRIFYLQNDLIWFAKRPLGGDSFGIGRHFPDIGSPLQRW